MNIEYLLITLFVYMFNLSIFSTDKIDIDGRKIPYSKVEKGYREWKEKDRKIISIPKNTIYCSTLDNLIKSKRHKEINKEYDTMYLYRMDCHFTKSFAEGGGLTEYTKEAQILFEETGARLNSGYFFKDNLFVN